MILQRTDARRRAAPDPWMVIVLGAVALAVMVAHALAPGELAAARVEAWGFRPATVAGQLEGVLRGQFDPGLTRLVTALFAHSSWLHLVGNLAYLWVFGIAVERLLGHLRFTAIFLVFGALANAFVAVQVPQLDRPVIGASGGVSALIGVYLGLFPARRIGLWLPLGLFLQFARIPALLVIGSWFTLQVLYTVLGPTIGAVAWWTHVAGFVAGLTLALAMRVLRGPPPAIDD